MPDYISSLFTLAEAEDLWSDNDSASDDAAEAQWAREKRVTAMLTSIASKMGLSLSDHGRPVLYGEEDREAQIDCYDGFTLEQLVAFSDIATEIVVTGSASHRDITSLRMKINPGFEDSTLT